MVRYFGQTTDVRIFNPRSAPPNQFVTLSLSNIQLDLFYTYQTSAELFLCFSVADKSGISRNVKWMDWVTFLCPFQTHHVEADEHL